MGRTGPKIKDQPLNELTDQELIRRLNFAKTTLARVVERNRKQEAGYETRILELQLEQTKRKL